MAEIVAAANDGNLLVYTDSEFGDIGFVDITDPADPQPAGKLSVQDSEAPEAGEPTSVAVIGDYALVALDTSASKVSPSGQLVVVKISTRMVVRRIPLNGQPDAIDIAPDGQRAAIAIENERDEDICIGGDDSIESRMIDDGNITEDQCEMGGGVPGGMPQTPQNPPGSLVIVNISDADANNWAILM